MEVLFTLLAVAVGAGIGWLLARRARFQSTQVTYLHTSLEGMRAVGELSVFKAITKALGPMPIIAEDLGVITPDVVALRKRAEACLLDVRCHDGSGADRFAAAARELSNCPSGANGGDLGWLAASDCAPEFAREVFGHAEVGVLPRLVHSRFGLHVVEVLARERADTPRFEAVRGAVALALRQQSFVSALRQYLQLLAGAARVEGVTLDQADTPLVQ